MGGRGSNTRAAGWLALAFSGGCHVEHAQSMLHPASEASASVAWLWWFLLAVCTAVLAIVVVLTGIAVFGRPTEHRPTSPLGSGFIATSGIFLPAIILIVILVVSIRTQVALQPPEAAMTVRVVGHQWWWEVEYPDQRIVSANEIYIPAGEPVLLELVSEDVIHSFWVPNLGGKTDLLPEKVNHAWIAADRPGVYRGQCAEYCGTQHALMGMTVVAVAREEFDAWVAERQQVIAEPTADAPQRGQEVFLQAGCSNCHTIRGTAATGERGPDLTHVGSRRTIGAGWLENNRGNLSGWIANPQALKPGNLMPVTHLPPDDLHAVVQYLMSLE